MTHLDAKTFQDLMVKWKENTKFSSNPTEFCSDPNYWKIAGYGRDALPYIFADIELHNTAMWYDALETITWVKTQDLINEDSAGVITEMNDAWLRWWYYKGASWDERVQTGLLTGGVSYTPNGLPIKCLNGTGIYTEGEHGHHVDYKFPATIEYTGPARRDSCGEFSKDIVYPIYSDGYAVLAMYEYCYTIWSLRDGSFLGGFGFDKYWKLTEESKLKLREIYDKSGMTLMKLGLPVTDGWIVDTAMVRSDFSLVVLTLRNGFESKQVRLSLAKRAMIDPGLLPEDVEAVIEAMKAKADEKT